MDFRREVSEKTTKDLSDNIADLGRITACKLNQQLCDIEHKVSDAAAVSNDNLTDSVQEEILLRNLRLASKIEDFAEEELRVSNCSVAHAD